MMHDDLIKVTVESYIIYSNNVDSDVEIIDDWHIKKIVDLPTQELENVFTVNTCKGLHASIYGYPVITAVHLYYFFEVWQMHTYS